MAEDNLVYILDGKIYINLTNRCTNDCVFCIRALKDTVGGADLRLTSEQVKTDDVIEQLKRLKIKENDEIIFCGYGEPLIKLEQVKEVAAFIKENYKGVKIRVNTNGMANMIHKRDVTPELAGLIDAVSVSLNAQNEELYNKISRPKPEYKGTYARVKEFIWYCANAKIETTATVVEGFEDYEVDVSQCEFIAKNLGATLRVRSWLPSGY